MWSLFRDTAICWKHRVHDVTSGTVVDKMSPKRHVAPLYRGAFYSETLKPQNVAHAAAPTPSPPLSNRSNRGPCANPPFPLLHDRLPSTAYPLPSTVPRGTSLQARSLENFFRGESAERIESGQPFETVGADWTGTNEDNQDERGTASGAAAPPSTTSEDLAQDVGIGEYRPATRDKEDEDGSIHDEAIVDPSTISPDDVAATGAVAKDSLGESSASPEGGVGVNVEPDAAGGDASPGDILEKEVLIHPFLQSTISHRLPSSSSNLQTPSLESVLRAESTERIGSGQPSPVTRGSLARDPLGGDSTGTNEDTQDERGTVPGVAAPPSTTSDDLAQDVSIGECRPAPRDKEDGDDSIHDETVVDPSTISPDDVAATGAVAKDSLGESSASPDGGVGVNVEPDAAGGDASPGDILEEEVLIHPFLQSTIAHRLPSSASLQPPSLESVLQAESTERIGSGQPSPATGGSSAQAPLDTVEAGWAGKDKENQNKRGTAPGDAAAPSTTWEDRVQGVDIGKCIPALGDEGDGDDSIHVKAVAEPSTLEPEDTAATLAAAEGTPRESSVSPGHGIGVSAEPVAARGDESSSDSAETAEGQGEGAAAGGLGGDAVPSVLEDLADEMVAALDVDDEEDDYFRYEGDDDDYYDDDDDDDDIDFFNYLSKYETESSKDVGQTTDARVWEGLAAALKVELEEKKVGVAYDTRGILRSCDIERARRLHPFFWLRRGRPCPFIPRL